MQDARYFPARAERCLFIARQIADPGPREQLFAMAADYAEKAEKLDVAEKLAAMSSAKTSDTDE
jgi:hypothetical protein